MYIFPFTFDHVEKYISDLSNVVFLIAIIEFGMFLTLVLEYIVMKGVGRTAEAEEMFKMTPFLRWTIFSRTKRHILVTDTTLQLISECANSLLFGTWNTTSPDIENGRTNI